MSISLILLAGGKGLRMNIPIPKTFLPFHGKPIVSYSFELFEKMESIDEIVVVCPEEYRENFPAHTRFAKPGKRRQDSVSNGLNQIEGSPSHVLIHDGARPFIIKSDITSLLEVGLSSTGAALANPVRNTLKKSNRKGLSLHSIDRADTWEVHTPQMVAYDLLKEGQKALDSPDINLTDDLSLVEYLGHEPKLVPCEFPNIKITYPSDFLWLEALIPKLLEMRETQHFDTS